MQVRHFKTHLYPCQNFKEIFFLLASFFCTFDDSKHDQSGLFSLYCASVKTSVVSSRMTDPQAVVASSKLGVGALSPVGLT